MNDSIITPELLEEFGITLSDEERGSFLEHTNATLEERIGAEITETLDDDQLKALLDLQEQGDEAKVGHWLRETVPELEQIIQDETDILLGEIAKSRQTI